MSSHPNSVNSRHDPRVDASVVRVLLLVYLLFLLAMINLYLLAGKPLCLHTAIPGRTGNCAEEPLSPHTALAGNPGTSKSVLLLYRSAADYPTEQSANWWRGTRRRCMLAADYRGEQNANLPRGVHQEPVAEHVKLLCDGGSALDDSHGELLHVLFDKTGGHILGA